MLCDGSYGCVTEIFAAVEAGIQLALLNEIADACSSEYPDVIFYMLAYTNNSDQAPTRNITARSNVGVMLAPGELAPEILYGGVTSAEQTWLGEGWDYPSLDSVVGVETLLCFGLCNDQIGYVIPDNDFRSYLTENEEITAVSSAAASTIAEAFIELVQSLD